MIHKGSYGIKQNDQPTNQPNNTPPTHICVCSCVCVCFVFERTRACICIRVYEDKFIILITINILKQKDRR